MTSPLNYLIGWVGGKRLLRPVIEKFIPTDLKAYIEPFGGAAWVLFYKEKWAECEVYNDLDGRLVNLFRCVKYHPEALIKELQYILVSREMFNQYLKTAPVTDIQRAARFFILINFSFGGKLKNFRSGLNHCDYGFTYAPARIDAINKRLQRVKIENLDFQKLIKLYDRDYSFFYCDPPYTKGEQYEISKNFDHVLLRDTLKNIKGRFLLTYNDCPEIRELYKDFDITETERLTGLNRKNPKNKMYKELLIKNY